MKFSLPILNVMSHSPCLSMSEPFAALILIGLGNNSVLCLLGILRYTSKDITHLAAPESHKL